MSIQEIICVVEKETRISKQDMSYGRIQKYLLPRYIAMMLLHEEDILPIRISKTLKISLFSVYTGLKVFRQLIDTDKAFKTTYLACIKRIAILEDPTLNMAVPPPISEIPRISTISSNDIFAAVEQHSGFTKQLLVSRARTRDINDIRCIALQLHMELLHKQTVVKIANIFHRNHSTVLYADKKFQALYQTEADFKSDYDHIKNLLKNIAA